jgi:hypothetical protein
MKFKINPTYIIIKTIKMLFGYILALAIVYTLINLQDFESFVISLGIVALILYYFFILRMAIKISGDSLVFVEENTSFKKALKLNDITYLVIKKKRFYSYVFIKTIEGKSIFLCPANPEEFIKIIAMHQRSHNDKA